MAHKQKTPKYIDGGDIFNQDVLGGFAQGAASGALTGAAAGGIGAVPGAIIGGLAGGIGGFTKNQRESDALALQQQQQALRAQQLFELSQQGSIQSQFTPPVLQQGGKVAINAEGSNGRKTGELEVKGGKVIKDLKGLPPHPANENKIDLFGNVLASPGNIIVPKDQRKNYLEGDKITRRTIELQLKRDQKKRDAEELDILRGGGAVSNKISKLVDEGRPHKQSVAIALDMERRGKLQEGGPITPLPLNIQPNPIDLQPVLPEKPIPRDILVGSQTLQEVIQSGQDTAKIPGLKKSLKEFEDFYGSPYSTIFPDTPVPVLKQGGKVKKAQQGLVVDDEFTTAFTPDTTQTSQFTVSPSGLSQFPIEDVPLIPFDPATTDTTAGRGVGFSDVAQFAPLLFNVGAGLFGETPTAEPIFDPRREEVARLMRERQVDFDPILRDIEQREATAARSLRGVSGGSAGQFIAGRTALATGTQRAAANARMQADLINQGFRADEARALAGIGAGEVAAQERAQQLNLGFEANRAQFLPKAAEQLASIGARTDIRGQQRERNQILREELERRRAAATEQAELDAIQNMLSQLP